MVICQQTIHQYYKNKIHFVKTKKKKSNHKIEISINNQNIEQVNQTTFLGVINIDENLTWNSHLNLIYKDYEINSDYIQDLALHKFKQ